MNAPPLHIKNAIVWDGHGRDASQRDLFVKNGRIVDEKPNHAIEVDLAGYTLFPGLVNAHDHLELNHYPRTKFREVYDNAHQWGEDVNARLNDEPFKTLRNYPIWDRLFIGGIKNLLCGATTVIHHGTKYREMFRKDFPVRVVKNYGWSHSLHFDSEEEIVRSYQSTPKDVPWFIHLAEGTDDVAASEYQRLKKLGCVGSNTVIVHGVGMTEDDIVDASKIIRGLVWCPSTNKYLLDQSAYVRKWIPAVNVALGSDSRLTADSTFADEIRAAQFGGHSIDVNILMEATSFRAAKIAGSSDIANTDVGSRADLFIGRLRNRSKSKLIIRDGMPQIGEPELMAKFPFVETVACTVDGVEKRMALSLAKQVHRCTLKERGLEVDDLPQGKRFFFF